ncbi:hypothetical protein OG767_20285 [Micromonospora sp. NBC_01392]|uniref:hypothetical protein n=1 Tax=Micromonospora sp. NBC_01392 TaxID=2903588 RepID=UPI00324D9D95
MVPPAPLRGLRARRLLRLVARPARDRARGPTGHPIVQSFEPGESWFWDYSRDQFHPDGPELAEPHAHPLDQPAPGPEGRVPSDWQTRLH